ncbi:metacaspase-2-like [Ruditapes philippinarum]|uniref:metacaspase-2-like n=1 Tax=Ruditapes philippinarum TaxID=129788 RepID=UPI00295A8238|nr:metacaspase-2-like [Ruditapes philippinarum]
MKRFLCKNCGELFSPSVRVKHEQECNRKQEERRSNQDNDRKLAKRQKNNENYDRNSTSRHTVNHQNNNGTNSNFSINNNKNKEIPICSKCEKQFSTKFNLNKHEKKCAGRLVKKTDNTLCGICRKQFTNYRGRLKHEKLCRSKNEKNQSVKENKGFQCKTCGAIFASHGLLVKHEFSLKHNQAGGSSTENKSCINNTTKNVESETNGKQRTSQNSHVQPKCRRCDKCFTDYKDLYRHRMLVHNQPTASNLQLYPWDERNESPPWENADGSINDRMKRVYIEHRHLILGERVREGDVRSTYNFPVPNLNTMEQLEDQINYIFERSQTAFKINISFGLILQHVESEEYRYFSAHYTDKIFLFPQLINNRKDIEMLLLRLSKLDIPNYFHKQKPNSKWRPVFISNVLYNVNNTSFPLGLSQPLPKYILHSKSIVSFQKNPYTKRLYADNLCFFRCLSYHKIKNIQCETLTKEFHNTWIQYCSTKKLKLTDVTLNRMCDLEQCFETNINVYELSEDKTVQVLYRSREVFSGETNKTMNLNLFEDHLSYVSTFSSYALKFQCRLCDKLFNRKDNLLQHQKTCQNATKLRFRGGYYTPPKSIFDQLKDLGVCVNTSLQNYPWFVTFDFEAMLKTVSENSEDRLTKTQLHQPVSVSVCSNVDSFENP